MATDLADLVEAFKREVAIPGTFERDFPLTGDDAITASLGDAFAEAQLDGFFGGNELDLEEWMIAPALSTSGAALVVIYAGIRMMRHKIAAMATRTRYQAGPVTAEQGASAQAQTELLRQLERRREQILANAHRGPTTFVLDGYIARGAGGMFPHEMSH